jgi:predicted ATP-dependent Lon-type protease
VTGRDIRALEKVLSGLVRLLYSHGELSDDELAELLALAVEDHGAASVGYRYLLGRRYFSRRIAPPSKP